MVNANYFREDLDSKLAHAIEEAGEFIAAAGKTLRWGYESYSPTDPNQVRNIDWLRAEAEDVIITVDRLLKELVEIFPID